jgi:hypothetical protein
VITSGITVEDRIVIGGLQKAVPGAKVVPTETAVSDGNDR